MELLPALVESLAGSGEDLKISVQQGTIRRVIQDMLAVPGTRGARILGEPMEIESNIKGNTVVILPLPAISWPAGQAARQKMLDSLAVLVLHSDRDKQVVPGEVILDDSGRPIDIKFSVEKFSTFAVLQQYAVTLNDIEALGGR